MTAKTVLRSLLRARREVASGPPIPAWPGFVERLSPGRVVASYMPIGSEADPAVLVQAALAADCRLALPHVVDRATPLRFLTAADAALLVPGPCGLRQPAAPAQDVEPAIIITPLLAFDRCGNRLGQGAGHYDRAFAAHPRAWRVGVAWSVQEVEALVADPWDVPLHAIVTEKEWIAPS